MERVQRSVFSIFRSDLIVWLDTWESCAHLGVAAPVVGVTHYGHHFEFIQRTNKSRQSHSRMLLGQKSRNKDNGSVSACSDQQRTSSSNCHLIVPGSKYLDDLCSHEMMP